MAASSTEYVKQETAGQEIIGCICPLRWEDMRRPNFGQPTRYEACIVTQASLYCAFIFWAIAFYSAASGNASASIFENCLESFLDFASTAVVLFRLGARDALDDNDRNAVVEARVSILLAFTMILLGCVFIGFATVELSIHSYATADEVTIEAALSVPSAILYLVVGMLQLNMAWVLNLRSLMQDATISILGAVVAIGTLISALVNLILWVDDPNGYDSAMQNYETDPMGLATAERSLINATDEEIINGTRAYAEARMEYHFHFWWLEDLITIITATFLLFFGVYFLIEDTLDGSCWWTSRFWCAPLPPRPPIAEGSGVPVKGGPDEKTQLIKG